MYLGTQKRDARLEQSLNQSLGNASSFLHAPVAGELTSPSQQMAKNEAFLELANAMEALPEDYRHVIILRHLDELSFAEIARKMDRSVDSVEKLWVRGLAKLRKSMGDSA
jgi:RNA polymerase sigma-70 factor (ECF subfamily)